jgi:hypothetical protein
VILRCDVQRDGIRAVLKHNQSAIRIHERHDATHLERTSFQEFFAREIAELNDVGDERMLRRETLGCGEKWLARTGPEYGGHQIQQAS